MCLVFWYIGDQNDKLKFAMIFNREEWSKRPTDPLNLRVIGDDKILCGLDKIANGTWLALNMETGMIAFLTNRSGINRKGLKNKIQCLIQTIQLKYPKLILNQPLSRGQLIMDLIGKSSMKAFEEITKTKILNKPNTQPVMIKEDKVTTKQISFCLKQDVVDPMYLEALAKRTLLRRDQYNAFNLFFGSLNDLIFYQIGVQQEQEEQVTKGIGSFCNYVDGQQERLEKQKHGMAAFEKVITYFNQNKITSLNQLNEELLKVAQLEFTSPEKFFGPKNPEADLFILEHEVLKRKRGTRTTTIILKVDTQIQMFEKTYI